MSSKKNSYELDGYSVEHIRNRNELKAIQILEEVIMEFNDFDHCQLCIEDVYGLTINQLPVRYIQVGGLNLSKGVSDEEIREIAREAIQKVINNPSHAILEEK